MADDPTSTSLAGTDGAHLASLLSRARALPPAATAVAWPLSADALAGPVDAAAQGLIEPWLVGPGKDIRLLAERESLDLHGCRLIDAPDPVQAAMHCARLARDGEVGAIMKGSLHTDELMAAVVARESGLRTTRRISHAFVMGVPGHPRLFIITDAAVNIAPDLEAKADIIRNAIRLAGAIGIDLPRVAILSAVETVTPKMASTVDAAALCKMADRGQILGGILDGPLAFDNAVSLAAARAKGIVSAVAGRADILVVPNIESGNMLAKQLALLGGAESAGIVLGLRVPVALTSRSDDATSRLASAALLRLAA